MKKFLLSLIVVFVLFVSCSPSGIIKSPDWVCGTWIYDPENEDMTEDEAREKFDNSSAGYSFVITKDSYGTNGWSIKWGDSKKFYENDEVTLNCTSYPSILESTDTRFKWQVYEDMANDEDYTITSIIEIKGDKFYYKSNTLPKSEPVRAFRFDNT